MLGSSVLNIKQSLLSMAFCCSKALASLIVVSLLLYCTSYNAGTSWHAQGRFVALNEDGTVDQEWGHITGHAIPSGLSRVKVVYSSGAAFAALKEDGTVAVWGDSYFGGNAPPGLSGVKAISSCNSAFAALKYDGTVVSWGTNIGSNGGLDVPPGLSGVKGVYSNANAFAALKEDGSVESWGMSGAGGDSRSVSTQISSDVKTIYSSGSAFAALKMTGRWYHGEII